MGKYSYDYPRPAVTADIALFHWLSDALSILLIQRAKDPFSGQWALPGGFVDMDETSAQAAARELREEAGLSGLTPKEFGVFDAPRRDPRGRIISVAYYAIVPAGQPARPRGGDDAAKADWFNVQSLPALAFDHAQIVQAARDRLRWQALYRGLAFDLLPETFTIARLLAVYQAVLARPVDPQALLKRLQALNLLEEIAGQPQATYRLDRPRLQYFLRDDRLAPLGDNPALQ